MVEYSLKQTLEQLEQTLEPLDHTLFLSSPKAYPFGLLSSKAETPFIINSKMVTKEEYSFKRGNWKTINDYIYINMFKIKKYRLLMSKLIGLDTFNSMLNIHQQQDEELFNYFISIGLRERFKQNYELRLRLYQTLGKQLVHNDKNILSLLNKLRFQNDDIVYNPKSNQEIPKIEVLKVINGVEKEIERNFSLSNDLDYNQLRKYASEEYKNIDSSDEIFLNINNIVPILKHRLREKIINQEIDKFKDYLLRTFITYILENDYPNVSSSEYHDIERQINSEQNVDNYKEKLYDIYTKNLKLPKINHIFKNLSFTPDKIIKELNHNTKILNEKILTPEKYAEKFHIKENDPFLPHYEEDVIIDNKKYKTVIHYAYSSLIHHLHEIGELKQQIDINSVSLNELVSVYNDIKREWINNNLKINNEISMAAKFKRYTILIHLLIATKNAKIVWNDKSDPILGVGIDNQGANTTGLLLEYLRKIYGSQSTHNKSILWSATWGENKDDIANNIISSFETISSNIWTHAWMINLAQDFKNTMSMIEGPTTSDLEKIYKLEGRNGQIKEDDEYSLYKAGLTIREIRITFPLIFNIYSEMKHMTESGLMNSQATVYFKKQAYYTNLSKKRLQFDIDQARKNLELLMENIELKHNIDKNKFITSILANKQTTNSFDMRWDRIYKWSHI